MICELVLSVKLLNSHLLTVGDDLLPGDSLFNGSVSDGEKV